MCRQVTLRHALRLGSVWVPVSEATRDRRPSGSATRTSTEQATAISGCGAANECAEADCRTDCLRPVFAVDPERYSHAHMRVDVRGSRATTGNGKNALCNSRANYLYSYSRSGPLV